LTVRRRVINKKTKHTEWHCTCDCGGKQVVDHTNLRAGRIQSCGCLSSERYGSLTLVKLNGLPRSDGDKLKPAEYLLVKDTLPPHIVYKTLRELPWECQEVIRRARKRAWRNRPDKLGMRDAICDCGKKINVGLTGLKDGSVTSCGCGLASTANPQRDAPPLKIQPSKRLSKNEVLSVLYLREKGCTHRKIAEHLSVTPQTVFNIIHGITHAEITREWNDRQHGIETNPIMQRSILSNMRKQLEGQFHNIF
jgi:hypothetical protein